MAERLEPLKLDPESKSRLEELAETERWLEVELRRAERAGLDVRELKERFEKFKEMRLGMLREYG